MMRRALFSLCFCIFALTSTSEAAENVSVKLPPHTKVTLKNGLTLLLMEQHEVPIVSFNIIVKTGSVADPQGKHGLASLTAELLRKGTRTRSSEQVSSGLDFIGAEFGMNANTDYTAGNAEFLKKDLRQGMTLIADILLNPIFPQEEVTKLIHLRIDGIKSAKDRADSVIGRYFSSYLYGKHPYARPVGGDEISLAGLTRADVQGFYDANYVPANTILAAVGDFTIPEMRSLIEQHFNTWVSKNPPSIQIEAPGPVQGKRLLLVDKPDSTQTYFYVGNIGINRTNPDRVAIAVVNTIFGGRFTSRLNTALRIDSGLTYGARSSFEQRKAAGPFLISTYTRNAATEQAMDMTVKVLSALHQDGITATELASVKEYMKGQFPPSIETSDQLASTVARLEFYGLDESDINSYFAKIDAVTIADTRRIIKQYFPLDNLVFVLIGKASEIQPTLKKYATVIDTKTITQPGF
jgi:zinc protease